MTKSKVYLDHNASTSLLKQARVEMMKMLDLTGNPSSVHANGRLLANGIDRARSMVADLAGAKREQVVFTGSASEAITQGIVGGVQHFGFDRVVVSAGEHKAVSAAAEASGAQVEIVGLDANGVIDLADLARILSETDAAAESVLVAMHWVNNETGVVQDVERMVSLVGPSKHFLMIDAVQAFGKMPIGFNNKAIDMMAVSAHKFGGPAGVGALLVKEHCNEVRLIPGGGQEQGRRGGTPSAILIAGFGGAANEVVRRFDLERLSKWMGLFESQIQALGRDIVVFGRKAKRIGTVCNFAMPGVPNETALIGLDLKGVCVSAGSACSSGKVSSSAVLDAMGVAPDMAKCALRVSAGWDTRKKDIDYAMDAIAEIYARHSTKHEKLPPYAVGS